MSVRYDHTKKVVPKNLIISFALITTCFALWGAANNMTDLLVTVFKQVKGMSSLQASIIQTVFYGAYFLAPIPAALIIKKCGYKTGGIVGLSLYALGAFLCYPASQADSFSFFLTAFYVFAFGCAMIETSVAPFILSMGPKETATQRINLAQSFNPVGSLGGICLGKFVILKHLTSSEEMAILEGAEKAAAQSHDLGLVVNAYAIVGVIALIVAAAIAFKKFPVIAEEQNHSSVKASIGRLVKNKNYMFSVMAQFFYVAAQIGIWTFIVPYVMASGAGYDNSNDAANFYIYSLFAFVFMRFVYTGLMKFIDPARLLSVAMVLSCLFTLLTIHSSGMLGVISVVMISATMSLGFPTIYGLGLMGLEGDDKKIGGSGIIMAIVGGAILVPLQGFMNDGKLPTGDFILDRVLNTLFSPIKSVFDAIGFEYSPANSYYMPLFCFVIIAIYGFMAHKKEADVGIIHETNQAK
ncbi:L-fucose:H+ symporter permease [Lentisphaera profundi]|uniref:L-fucose:H+ symporter permease n=1 Tax=Lentisphaera profundi TaxID=1658616 RepID=A0ABY7VV29_9BACT|nr:L-fucose:H+ symporter permease [Lentisphaera profundi]WDE97567.1 L-fucose:H+ symporter permease [Lentisphaera profundi]